MEAKNNNIVKILFIGLVCVAVGTGLYFSYIFFKEKSDATHRLTDAYDSAQTAAYYDSLTGHDPSLLKENFVEDAKKGVNDKFTKSNAYFVTHRFFDNGGNIYEIYDYVNSHHELAFLKDAEGFYPKIFEQIEKKSLPIEYSGKSLHAYLGYLRAMERHGYGSLALRGTVANQYAKTVFLVKKVPEQFAPDSGVDVQRYLNYEIEMSLHYATKAKEDVAKILNGELTTEDITDRDIVVGLNQYASALRYYEYLGIEFDSPKTAKEIFAFSTNHAKSFVKELSIFTGLLDASTLLLDEASNVDDVRVALAPLMTIDSSKLPIKEGSVPDKVIKSRFEIIPFYPGTQVLDKSYDVYGKENAKGLALKVPEFKQWLMTNGWTETDFQ